MSRKRPPVAAPDASLSLNAALPIAARLDECLASAEAIHGPEDTTALHRLRIAVKRLRYTVEIFSSATEGAEEYLETLKRLQDLLGEIHDADVLAPLLCRAVESGEADRPGLRALLERTLGDRKELYSGFRAFWDEALVSGFPDRLRAAAYHAALGGCEHQAPEVRDLLVLMELASAVGDAPAKEARRARKALAGLSVALAGGDTGEQKAPTERASKALRRLLESGGS